MSTDDFPRPMGVRAPRRRRNSTMASADGVITIKLDEEARAFLQALERIPGRVERMEDPPVTCPVNEEVTCPVTELEATLAELVSATQYYVDQGAPMAGKPYSSWLALCTARNAARQLLGEELHDNFRSRLLDRIDELQGQLRRFASAHTFEQLEACRAEVRKELESIDYLRRHGRSEELEVLLRNLVRAVVEHVQPGLGEALSAARKALEKE